MKVAQSTNSEIRPITATVNEHQHLVVGGRDTVELAREFGTPLWIMDEKTMTDAMAAYKYGLQDYPGDAQVLYAGKAFLCTAMIHLLRQNGLGLDVVSHGELATAISARFPADKIFMHGNNKSEAEVASGLAYGDVRIVVDNLSELRMVAQIAERAGKRASLFVRVIPGVEPDTHVHIVTGHDDSKFGVGLEELIEFVREIVKLPSINLLGLHAHIGSQAHEVEPFKESVEILADAFVNIKNALGLELTHLDVGGGLGIAYTNADKTTPITEWSRAMATAVEAAFGARSLKLPHLFIEPGRTIVGSAGVTLYTVGHVKDTPAGKRFIAVDGGMADNPRPITYDAKYTACVANRMNSGTSARPTVLAGKFCESGDIIIKETHLDAESGDLVAVFGTGAYNYSMASNYNRTARPACVLVSNGSAEIIIERESFDDLLRQDRVPERLLR